MSSRIHGHNKGPFAVEPISPFQRQVSAINEALTRLNYSLEKLKFSDGFSHFYKLLKDIEEKRLREDINDISKILRYLQEQRPGVKQLTIVHKLKEFVENYRTKHLIQSRGVQDHVRTEVSSVLQRVQNIATRVREGYGFDHVIVTGIRDYRLAMGVNNRDSESKRASREGILGRLKKLNQISDEEKVFLIDFSNFEAFHNNYFGK